MINLQKKIYDLFENKKVQNLASALPEKLEGITSPSLCRAWTAIRALRMITAKVNTFIIVIIIIQSTIKSCVDL